MKKTICAMAVMVICFAGQAMAAGGKTPESAAKKEVLSVGIVEKAGNWHCDCECSPEERMNDSTKQVCRCQCFYDDWVTGGWARTEEKMFQFQRWAK